MNGQDHYREAEWLLERSKNRTEGELDLANADALAAQVHATLALVAASVADRGIGPQELSGWHSLHADDHWREATR